MTKKHAFYYKKRFNIQNSDNSQRYIFLQSNDKESLMAFDMKEYTIETYPFFPETPLGKIWSNGIYIEKITDTNFHINAHQIDNSIKRYTIKRTNKPKSFCAFINEL